MITQNFNSPDIAERTLDIYTAAVLREAFVRHVLPTQPWRDQMQRLSDVSCNAYRDVVRSDPRFVPYFRQATPELELASLNIGSRPSKRNPKGGIESLRAIPWTFAWTQNRLHLSTWLGVGKALNSEVRDTSLFNRSFSDIVQLTLSSITNVFRLCRIKRIKLSCVKCMKAGHGFAKT